MSTVTKAVFLQLARGECEAMLARNRMGRLAYAWGNDVGIEPAHYVCSGGWIYGSTSKGKKIEMTGCSCCPVAFRIAAQEVSGREAVPTTGSE